MKKDTRTLGTDSRTRDVDQLNQKVRVSLRGFRLTLPLLITGALIEKVIG